MKLAFAYPEDLSWLEARTGYSFTQNARGLLAVDDEGKIRGGVAYDHWSPSSCEMHQVFETPIAMRCLLPDAFTYPFLKADKKLIYGRTPSNHKAALNQAYRFGFEDVATLEGAYDVGVDIKILRLRREDCRYLKRGVK